MLPSSSQMDNAILPTAKKACLELISCKCMKRAGGTVNVTERTLFALTCADVSTRVMSSDVLNWNLLINLLDNWPENCTVVYFLSAEQSYVQLFRKRVFNVSPKCSIKIVILKVVLCNTIGFIIYVVNGLV